MSSSPRTMSKVAALALALMAASLARGATEYQQLRQAFDRAIANESWLAVIDFGTKLHEIDPGQGGLAYNLACAHTRAGHMDDGLHWLGQSAHDGFSATALVARDTDLEPLRERDEYAEILARIEANASERLEEFKLLMASESPITAVPRAYLEAESRTVVIALHGQGGHPAGIGRAWAKPARRLRSAVVAPAAGRRSGAGYEWRFVDESEWLILETRRWAIEELGADPDRIVVSGFSQGGNMALRMALKHPDKFQGAVVIGGHWFDDLWPEGVAPDQAPQTRVALMIGSRDPAAKSNKVARDLLESRGIAVRYKSFSGLGHRLPLGYDREFERALRFVLNDDTESKP